MFTIQRTADGGRHGVPSQPSESEDYFAFFDPHFHGVGMAAAGQAARSRRGSRLCSGIAPAACTLRDQQRRRPASAVTKAAAAASSPQGGGGERVPEGKPGAVSFLKRGWGSWEIGSESARRRGLGPRDGRATLLLLGRRGGLQCPRPNSPSRPLVAVEQADCCTRQAPEGKKGRKRKSG